MPIDPRIKCEKLLEAARGYLLLDMPDHALDQLRGIAEPRRSSFTVNQLRGECLRQKEAYHDALEAFEQAIAERPNDVAVLLGMAWCYKRTGRLPHAIAATQQAYRACPDEPVILYNLACYFALRGNKSRALSWLGRALRKDGALRRLIPGESDFDRIRSDPDFQFVAGLRSRCDA